ncbi:FERM domain-containing protein 6 [Anguilla anguilla]|uniref:FERM domain-containing protein 6 n=1 Tax=Anguilla anguilla TaxID=7936 RepID=UPI0015B011BB|nr:FERM domain-containing protein 6 [Anguilla anguilla]XP_035255482.1 FERM domain-containing protein 6 [Anguilla anguilla]
MSLLAKLERNVCVLLPNKEQLDITVGVKAIGQEVFNRVSELVGIKELHFFGLTVVKDNEHIFLDLEEKLTKYFPKEWKPDSGKGTQRRALPLLLFLKVQYYVENGRLICDRKARRLYYADLRERVLRSECRQQEALYFQLAGYALQADLADCPQPGQADGEVQYFQPKDYFPPWIVAKRGREYLLCHGPKVHRELWGMSARDAILLFIRESCRLEDVPVTFYRLQKDKKEERGSALLGLTLRGMQVYQEMNNIRQLLYDFPWSNVGRLTFLGKKFEIQPDGLPSARKLVYYTGSPFRSRHLLQHLSNSHRLYLNIQPALKQLRQLEENEEKKRYRESYISDDLDLDPTVSEGSPGLSRRSTSSSGIEADSRQRRVSMEMPSVEEEEEALQRTGKPFGSAASHGSSHTSGVDTGSKARTEEEDWQEEEAELSVDEPEEVSVDEPEMLRLVELIEGVSLDCPDLTPETHWGDDIEQLVDGPDYEVKMRSTDSLEQVLKWRTRGTVDRHSQSLDDVRLFQPPTPLGTTLQADTSHSYTFGLPDPKLDPQGPVGRGCYPLYCPAKPSFYGRRSMNCLSLDLLGDEQLLEFIL